MKNIHIFKKLFLPFDRGKLNTLIFFVTGRCNARCKMCFYKNRLNKSDDLEFDEIKNISQNLPEFNSLLLSGGEPFLRNDLLKIIGLFITNNRVKSVTIPTNGLMPETIYSKMEEILERFQGINISISFSIDGPKDIHERIRGVPAAHDKLLDSIGRVTSLKEKFTNLEINTNTVITAQNYCHLDYFLNLWRLKNFKGIDRWGFEIVRGIQDGQFINLDQKKLAEVYLRLLNLQYEINYYKKRSLFNKLKHTFELAQTAFRFKIQYKNFVYNQRWNGFYCKAGETIIVINSNGDFQICELARNSYALREYNYDIKEVLNDSNFRNEIRMVKLNKCSCTHVCFIYESLLWSKRVMYGSIPFIIFGLFLFKNKFFKFYFER